MLRPALAILAVVFAANAAQAQQRPHHSAINFGDNASRWANDGECDDPRFMENHAYRPSRSRAMAYNPQPQNMFHDANDCRNHYIAGWILLRPGQVGTRQSNQFHRDIGPQPLGTCGLIDFGDNTGKWVNDGECDDPRFRNRQGRRGMADTLLEEDLGHDANDCRTLCLAGAIEPRR